MLGSYFRICKKTIIPNCVKIFHHKRADRSLYCSEKFIRGFYRTKMKNKIKRTWKPNEHQCFLFSQILEKRIPLKVSDTALKMIDSEGGIDNYILSQKILESKKLLKLRCLYYTIF